MDTALHSSLSGLEAQLAVLLGSITSSPTAAGAPAAALALLDADDALSRDLQTLRTHQTNYGRILRLRAQVTGLEERIRQIVRDISGIGDEISAARNEGYASDSDESDDDYDDDSESTSDNGDVRMTTGDGYRPQRRGPKEVDYKLLLDFARRISTYNVQAAADAAAGIGKKSARAAETEESTERREGEKSQKDAGLAAVTQEATSWLNESANMTRDASLVPYPTEDRIRMGLMGQLQAAAAEKGGDPEKEVEQLLRAAESGETDTLLRTTQAVPGMGDISASTAAPEPAHDTSIAGAVDVSVAGTTGGQGAKPKPKFDLDLYDPDDDDV